MYLYHYVTKQKKKKNRDSFIFRLRKSYLPITRYSDDDGNDETMGIMLRKQKF